MSPNAVAKALRAEGWYSKKTKVYYVARESLGRCYYCPALKSSWQRHVLASSGYLELGMLDDAAQALEEVEPEDKTRTEVLGARIALYITTKKWDIAAAVASHLAKG
jgi:hypothetical protein